MNNTLNGIRLIELSTYVAGPSAAEIFADLGAEVIKVESFGGDQWRTTARNMSGRGDDETPVFDIYNKGKKSIAINLKNPEGKAAMLKLLSDADVFLTNVREGSLKKLGLDYDSLREIYPELIYASVDGFGRKGPDAASPGFDNLSFWARSGFAADMPYKTKDHYPLPVLSGIGDVLTGGFLAAGISAALYNRECTGKGDLVTVSLYGTAVWAMSTMLLRGLPEYGGHYPVTPLEADPLTNSYRCSDGEWVNIALRNFDRETPLMFELLGITEEVEQAGGVRADNYFKKCEIIVPLMTKGFLTHDSAYWIKTFTENDIVIGKLMHMTEVVEDPQALANGYITAHTNINGTHCPIANQPIRFGSYTQPEDCCAPKIGENTAEILRGYGYSDPQIAELIGCGAVKEG